MLMPERHLMKSEVMKTGTVSSREVIATVVRNLDKEAQSLLQTIPGLSRNIRNWRQHTLGIPALPACRSGFEIPDAVKYLENGSLFLVFDESDKSLVFYLEKCLDDLESSENWACDGTFKVSPSLWCQLLTLHITSGGSCVLRLFALLPDKKEASYLRVVSAVRDLRANCRPAICLMNFEKALHNSFASVFPHLEVVGCVLHLRSSVWRKVSALGESRRYIMDEGFQLKIKCFCALAFLPIEDVVNGFEDLSDVKASLLSLSLILRIHTSGL
uniref:MULE transposase domain-containing protein n=1 Tax=Octopus bimaculoides TaxID=37653 RepID=A0A0L8GFH2_OCTBM